LMLPPSVRIFAATAPADLRRSFDGLYALARDVILQDPLSGHLFLFRNRTGDRVKVLWWDRTGLCLFYKRLEKGVFRLPASKAAGVEIDAAELMLLLEGIDLTGARRQARYVRPAPAPR
jgi:transposase